MSETEKNMNGNKINQKLKIESTKEEAEIALIKLLSKTQCNFQNKESKTPSQARYIWAEKGKLCELVDILFKKKFIKTKKEFFALFEKHSTIAKVKWNADMKYHLAYLLYRLYKEKHFIMIGNKGYFKYAEEHFLDFNGTPFKKNALKNIKLKILNNKEDYVFICRDVDDIIFKCSDV